MTLVRFEILHLKLQDLPRWGLYRRHDWGRDLELVSEKVVENEIKPN